MTVPQKTGIPSLLKYLRIICRLLVTFRPVVAGFLTAPQLAAWDALRDACETFETLIEHPNKGD